MTIVLLGADAGLDVLAGQRNEGVEYDTEKVEASGAWESIGDITRG